MTAKEKQLEFIKSYLKPTLKNWGYKTISNTWWKDKGDFVIIINLQNSQWNSKNELSFCFNVGVALTEFLENKNKPSQHDIITHTREDAFIPESRRKHTYRKESWLGYFISDTTNMADFTDELKIDFESNILPTLDSLQSLDDCVEYYERYPIWGDMLKRKINELRTIE